jgi:hypothetical protein
MTNAGLSALMPGQAAPNMAGVLPQPSQAAPDAVPSKVDALARLPFEQLQAMYRNPPKGVPAYAIIAARDKQIKAEQMRQAQQGLMAQQQVAGQRGTVADNVMGMNTVYAAGGGEMRVQGYADGNAVKQEGLSADDAAYIKLNDAIEAAAQILRTAEAERSKYGSIQRQKDPLGFAIAQERVAEAEKALAQARKNRAFPQQAAPAATPPSAPPSAQAAQTAPVKDATGAQRTPPPADRGLGATRTPPPEQTPPPAATQRRQQSQVPAFDINELISAINATGVIPPEILEERKALEAARKAQLERQQAAAKRYEAVLEESPEDRRMRAFAAIAKGLSSSPRLSKGLSAALSELVGSETEARRARREGMKEVMTLEDAATNLQIAMQEQALANRTNDNRLKTAAAIAVAQAQRDFQKMMFEQGIAAREVAAKEVAAGNSGGSSADNALLRERAKKISDAIEVQRKIADPLSPYKAEEKAKAQQAITALEKQYNKLLGLKDESATKPPLPSGFPPPPPGAVTLVRPAQ